MQNIHSCNVGTSKLKFVLLARKLACEAIFLFVNF